ncbi:cytochrome P450 family protein [Mycobacterium xenopi 4042]|uniref:Cytochrome P450 family protein n=1 Tax=Mycobacterium xenopi 4042 TaxID=1299334 RepID=X8AI61_MYCXE|nr:cytochrome P450 family protein [Mycobacterium xenopi 4042]
MPRPLLRRQLIADPELIKKGTDELLRLYSPTLAWPAPCPATRSSMASRCVPAIRPS